MSLPFSSWAPAAFAVNHPHLLSQLPSPFSNSVYRNLIFLNPLQHLVLLTTSWNHQLPWLLPEHSLLVLFLPFEFPLWLFHDFSPAHPYVPPELRIPSSAPPLFSHWLCSFHEISCIPRCLPHCVADLEGLLYMFIWMSDRHSRPHMSKTLSPCASLEFAISVMPIPIDPAPQAKTAPSSPPCRLSQPPVNQKYSTSETSLKCIFLFPFPLPQFRASSFLTWTLATSTYHPPCLPLSFLHTFLTYHLTPEIQTWSYPLLKMLHGVPSAFWIKSKVLSTNRKILYHLHFLSPLSHCHMATPPPNVLFSSFLNVHWSYTREQRPHHPLCPGNSVSPFKICSKHHLLQNLSTDLARILNLSNASTHHLQGVYKNYLLWLPASFTSRGWDWPYTACQIWNIGKHGHPHMSCRTLRIPAPAGGTRP